MSDAPRYTEDFAGCLDCGVAVIDEAAHTRFHSILSSHARALTALKDALTVVVVQHPTEGTS